ncbi:MAG: T9SS type A sorting domain-containing protein [Bacteroidetes bacterium]|nr:T9SS type A sorting domain-containing protein [Bacteroidota bacterium]
MKKKSLLINIFLLSAVGLISFSAMENENVHEPNQKSAGGPPYNTNAPTEKTCSGTEGTNSCHSGGTPDNTGPATCSIISSGGTLYVPGQTYTITPTITHQTRTRFGFQFTARVLSNNSNAGAITITDTTDTWSQFPGYGNCQTCEFALHKKAGTYFSNTTGSWNFLWTAPSSNVGNIRLYACFLAANNNNTNDSGDECYYTTLTLTPSGTGIHEQSDFSSSITIYPNPSSEIINLSFYSSGGEIKIELLDMAGKQTSILYSGKNSAGEVKKSFDVNKFTRGIYWLKISSAEKTTSKKIILL